MSEPDHAAGPLSAKQLVQTRLAERRFFEARFLLKRIGREMEPAEHERLQKEIEKGIQQVNDLVRQARELAGKKQFDDALACYKEARNLVGDFPGLDQAVQELEVRRRFDPMTATEGMNVPDSAEHGPNVTISEPGQKKPAITHWQRPHRTMFLGGMVLLMVLTGLGLTFFQVGSESEDRNGQPGAQKVQNGRAIDESDKAVQKQSTVQKTDDPERLIVPQFSRDPLPGLKEAPSKRKNQLAETIIVPPITSALPMPEMAVHKSVVSANTAKEVTQTAEREPFPVFKAGVRQVAVRFLPFQEEEQAEDESRQTGQKARQEKSVAVESEAGQAVAEKGQVPATSGKEEELVAGAPRPGIYTVREGDSLQSIARRIYGQAERWFCLVQANTRLLPDPPYRILPGMELVLPSGEQCRKLALVPKLNADTTYTVQSGDTLGRISQKFYGTSRRWKEIFALNQDLLATPAALRVGQRLKIYPDTNVSDGSREDVPAARQLSEKEDLSAANQQERE